MSGDAVQAILMRIYGANDAWAELVLWLGEQRERNQRLGGADDTLICLLVMQLAMVALPVTSGGQR